MVAMGRVGTGKEEERGGEVPLTEIRGMNSELPLSMIQRKNKLAPIQKKEAKYGIPEKDGYHPDPIHDVTCPDQTLCPTGTTCCQIQSGGYGCCPFR